jgi:hypothetical protein
VCVCVCVRVRACACVCVLGLVGDSASACTQHNAKTPFADHGTMLGDHGDTGKTMPWEGSAHVPLVVVGPMVPASRKLVLPVTIMDLAATYIDYAGGVLAPGDLTTLFHPPQTFHNTSASKHSSECQRPPICIRTPL